MANQALNGKIYLLRTRTGAVTANVAAFVNAVCLTSVSFATTDSTIDTSSKCTDGWGSSIQGEKGWSISADAQYIAATTDSGTVAWQHYFNLWKQGTAFEAEIYNVEDEDDVIRGTVRVTDIPATFPNNDVATWSLTLSGVGEVFYGAAA